MKKILTVSAALFIALSCIAQEHLSFMGIPIEGSMKSFCEKLTGKGFTKVGNDGSATMFTGVFTGREAVVGVFSDDAGENVYSVGVVFEPSGEWKVLVDTYNYYKDLYTRKYGKPKRTVERNKAAELDASNTGLMAEVNERKATWSSLWQVEGGEIELFIEKTGFYEGSVVIRYRDAQNEEAKIQKHLEDI